MVIEIYGKRNCSRCEGAKRKVTHFLDKWGVAHMVEVVFRDMDTVDGAAEGDFYDVFEIPSVLLRPRNGSHTVLARWDGAAPPARELHERLCA